MTLETPSAGSPRPPPQIAGGRCHALFAYDIGQAIDLSAVERLITFERQRETVRHPRQAPQSFQYTPPPLRITRPAAPVRIGEFETSAAVELTLYDFGALSVAYVIPVVGPLTGLLALSEALYDNAELHTDARRQAERLLDSIRPAVSSAHVANLVEDYVVFQIEALAGGVSAAEVVAQHAPLVAQILRAEPAPLSAQEVQDALSCTASYGREDLALIDWYATLLFNADPEDVRTVLEYVNVELLEMRFLDRQLDRALDESYRLFGRKRWRRALLSASRRLDMQRVARLQADSAALFEVVNNALKLIGDQYLARVYRLASARLHVSEWDTTILRKLQVLESIYGKLSDEVATRRMEVLEWIIIVLIAISIVLPFLPGGQK